MIFNEEKHLQKHLQKHLKNREATFEEGSRSKTLWWTTKLVVGVKHQQFL